MTLLSPTEFKAAAGGAGATTVDDTSLQTFLDAAEQAITARRGIAGGPITETLSGRQRVLFLSRPAASIASVTEYFGNAASVMDASDYIVRSSQMSLSRLRYGTHGADRWADRVVVVYTPVDDTAERKRVQIALVKLDLAFSGFAAQSTQNEARTEKDYLTEREAILDTFVSTTEMRY